jgi:sortase (surface protein transpeptidase)
LIIPAIEVNATIEPLGLTATGDLQVPQTRPFDDVGWYRLGKRPGEHGNAVIDGHLDRQDGSPAVFWNLRQLQPGEHVLVIDAVGHTFSFHIDQIVRYPPDQAPLTQIFGPATGVHLNLITCAGVWIPAQHQTTLRLVVYTTLDQPSPDI